MTSITIARWLIPGVAAVCLLASPLAAADHKVEAVQEAAPSDAVSEEIASQLASTGVKVIRGSSTVLCEIWPCKQWNINSFDTSIDIIYPFQPGQLVGVIRVQRSMSDFREQDIEEGVYILRYAQQPVDGAHVGTSPTRDFLLLLPASEDQSAEPLDYEPLTAKSAEVAGTAHPALLSMQRIFGEAGDLPSIRHDEQNDWWIVRLSTQAKAGDETKELLIDLVVVGAAPL